MTYQEEIRAQLARMSGWCDPLKGIAIAETILAERCQSCLEVGVFSGKSLLSAAYGLRELERATSRRGVIHGVDSWSAPDSLIDTSPADAEWWSKNVDLAVIYEECLEHIAATKLGRYVTLHRASSLIAAKLLDGPFDFIHIDGCHSEWSSTSDVTLWLPRLRPGGILIMDDVNWESTQTAVRFAKKFCGEPVVTNTPESVFGVFRKRAAAT